MNIIPELQPYIDALSVSEPIFKLKESNSGKNIECDLKHTYVPIALESDPLAVLVQENFQETFSKTRATYELRKDSIYDCAFSDALRFICKTIRRHSDTAKPEKTKLYKYYASSYNFHEGFKKSGIILVYKYLKEIAPDCDSIRYNSCPKVHNVLLLLETMQKKYGER